MLTVAGCHGNRISVGVYEEMRRSEAIISGLIDAKNLTLGSLQLEVELAFA